ncbi:MAG: beta-ketoacyl-[acyl-carrier-protein] synthase family protein [Planctomycetota bacterium]
MSARRVVITGAGWVTPLGADIDSVWSKLLAGHSAIGPIEQFEAGTFATNFAAEVKRFRLEDFLDAPASIARHAEAAPATRFGLAAAAQAWSNAGYALPGCSKRSTGAEPASWRRVGAYLGAGEGALDYHAMVSTMLDSWDAEGRRVDEARWGALAMERMAPAGEIEQDPHYVLAHLANELGFSGPSYNCMTACAAGTQCVGEAFEILRRGDADVMLAGGSHSMIHPLGMTGFIRLTAMSTRRDDPSTAARPFDRSRDGFVMGEGAGIVVLEDLKHALAREAPIIAEVAGFGSSADAYRITDIKPDGSGAQAAIRMALKQAGISPNEPDADGRPPVQYISAHGTGTQENDGIETAAIKGVFGALAPRIPFSSVKSMLGHLIQAAGVVELITCLKAIETGFVPPTINLHEPDARCDLDHVPNEAKRVEGGVDVCLSNGFGFGGQNNTLCVRRFEA